MSNTDVVLRHPVLEDGTAVFDLVDACKPLDLNSHYLYLLQCSHFAPTCVVATLHGEVVAWVSGYVTPNQTDTFFVWQVAVGEKARGLGLGKRLINWVVAQQNGIKKFTHPLRRTMRRHGVFSNHWPATGAAICLLETGSTNSLILAVDTTLKYWWKSPCQHRHWRHSYKLKEYSNE